MVGGHAVHFEHDEACQHCAAKSRWIKAACKNRADAKLLQDGVALGIALGMTMQAEDGPLPQFGDLVHAEVDPEAWFIFDLFQRYGEQIRRSSRHAYEGFSREDWLMDLIAKLVEDQPTSLVPYAEDDGAYAGPRNTRAKQPDDIGAWLTTVLFNAKRNADRDQRLHREILAKAILDASHWTHVENHGESAEATFMRRESEREILGRIKRLPRYLGQVAYLAYWGFPNEEIAWLLDVHRNTVSKRLREIRSPRIRVALGLPYRDEPKFRGERGSKDDHHVADDTTYETEVSPLPVRARSNRRSR